MLVTSSGKVGRCIDRIGCVLTGGGGGSGGCVSKVTCIDIDRVCCHTCIDIDRVCHHLIAGMISIGQQHQQHIISLCKHGIISFQQRFNALPIFPFTNKQKDRRIRSKWIFCVFSFHIYKGQKFVFSLCCCHCHFLN